MQEAVKEAQDRLKGELPFLLSTTTYFQEQYYSRRENARSPKGASCSRLSSLMVERGVIIPKKNKAIEARELNYTKTASGAARCCTSATVGARKEAHRYGTLKWDDNIETQKAYYARGAGVP